MNGESICIEQNPSIRLVTRRKFIDVAALSGGGVVRWTSQAIRSERRGTCIARTV